MVTEDQIKEAFEGYEVKSEVDSVYGDWVVSNDADVINAAKHYPIYTPQVKAEGVNDWLDHMREKTWFDNVEESNFIDAYNRAKEIINQQSAE